MARCGGCNCHYPVDIGGTWSHGAENRPCAQDQLNATGTYSDLPCGFVIVFGCDHPWWKHSVRRRDAGGQPRAMLTPFMTYENPAAEPLAAYPATFIGKACHTKTGLYCQYESARDAFVNQCCNLSSSTSTTGRRPYSLDANGKMIQPTAMQFDVRDHPKLLSLFGGDDPGITGFDQPHCCWLLTDAQFGVGQTGNIWQGWSLELFDPGPGFRTCPRLHYLEGNDAFWTAVGKQPPRYGLDSTFRTDGSFDPTSDNQFALENPAEWPSLPKRVCVWPMRWPFFNSPCTDVSEGCKSCAPAIDTYYGGGLYITADVSACDNGNVTVSLEVQGLCYNPNTISDLPAEHNGTLPAGVTDPGAPCGYWWKEIGGVDDCLLGVLVYWSGAAWVAKLYLSEGGADYALVGELTKENEECRCGGIYFTVPETEVALSCCTPCTDCPCRTTDDPQKTVEIAVVCGDQTLTTTSTNSSGGDTCAFDIDYSDDDCTMTGSLYCNESGVWQGQVTVTCTLGTSCEYANPEAPANINAGVVNSCDPLDVTYSGESGTVITITEIIP